MEGLGGERESGEVAWEDQARMDACMSLRASRGSQSEISRLRGVLRPWLCHRVGVW